VEDKAMEAREYDVVVIGGGPGGYVAAIRAAQLGAKVAVVEKERIGGTCLNRGCIPTKTMVRSTEVYLAAKGADKYGVEVEGRVRPNFARIMARKNEVVSTLVEQVIKLMEAHRIDIYHGVGTILKPGLVRVRADSGSQDLSSRKIIIATGSVPAIPPIPGTDLPGVLTTRQLLDLEELPKSLVIIGGSTIGLEFACIFNALGTSVSVVGRRTFLKRADQSLARRLRPSLVRRGIKVVIGLTFKEIVPADGKLRVVYERKGKEEYVEGEKVLLATGRWPYTEGLGVEELGIKMERRAILVNEYMETNIPGIYAIGDVLGTYMMAHTASYQGEVAVENALGHRRAADYRAVPACIFTSPEIASVGLTEQEAKEKGIDFQVARFPFSASGKAMALGETEGQVRIIHEKGSGKVLGVHIMGPHATDLIAEGVMAIQLGATVKDIAETIHGHPTLSEAVMEAAKAGAFGEAIHYRKI